MTKNQELLLTKEEVLELTEEEAKRHLAKVERHYKVDTPLNKLGDWRAIWKDVDDITNTMLWLEDHINKLKKSQV